MSTKKAVVLGATGAVGRELVGQLLTSPAWASVVTVGRREVEVPAQYASGWAPSKLTQVVVDMDRLEEEAAPAFEGAEAVFCALGTTRAAAGSADAFRRVDLDYVVAAARAARAASVATFSLCSAAGANAGLPSSDWKPLHGLLYSKTKGQAEEAAKAQGFPRTSIFRPGLLDRGDQARPIERWLFKVVKNVPVSQVAHAMISEAERRRGGGEDGVRVFSMGDILNM